jgi:hypothetical protein
LLKTIPESLTGVKHGILIEYRLSPAYKIFIGGEYQFLPKYKSFKTAYLEDTSAAQGGTFDWEETIKLTGYSITAGAAYSF